MAKHSYRLIVCFDIDADSLIEAYGKLVVGLKDANLAWETSDEWYSDEDEDKNTGYVGDDVGDVDVLNAAITQYYKDNPPKET